MTDRTTAWIASVTAELDVMHPHLSDLAEQTVAKLHKALLQRDEATAKQQLRVLHSTMVISRLLRGA